MQLEMKIGIGREGLDKILAKTRFTADASCLVSEQASDEGRIEDNVLRIMGEDGLKIMGIPSLNPLPREVFRFEPFDHGVPPFHRLKLPR